MFGAFKKFFSKPAKTAPEEPLASYSPPQPSRPQAYAPAPAAPPAAAGEPGGDVVAVYLTAIIPKLPPNLTGLVIKSAGATFKLPAKTALDQLPTGKVRIPFGQLRTGVPFGTFADNASHDQAMIELPLAPIIAGLNPAMLARRAQRRIEVPDEVTGVFGPKGKSSAQVAATPNISGGVTATPEPVEAAPAPVVEAPPPAPVPIPAPTPVIPISPIAPAATPTASAKPVAPFRPPTAPAKPVTAAPSPLPFAQKPAAKLPSMGPRPAVPPPPARVAAAPSPIQAAPPAPITATGSGVVNVPLSDISDSWPDAVRQEIARGEWDLSMVVMPVSRLDPGMKTGRLLFTWGDLRQWLNPPIGSVPSPNGEVQVELPLKIIAPLFLAARQPGSQRRVNIGENIPDVFTGLKTGAAQATPVSAAPAAPAAPLSEIPVMPVAPVAAAPAHAAAAPSPVSHAPRPDALGAIFGQPLKSDWSPAEITQKIAAFAGVVDVVLATTDGLLVAGQVSAPRTAEGLGAFLPQIFARADQYATDMQLGPLTALNLFTADAPCAVFKAGKLYLGVIGRRGQPLPEALLLRVAAELAKRNS